MNLILTLCSLLFSCWCVFCLQCYSESIQVDDIPEIMKAEAEAKREELLEALYEVDDELAEIAFEVSLYLVAVYTK